jgi:hypothetical protein
MGTKEKLIALLVAPEFNWLNLLAGTVIVMSPVWGLWLASVLTK